MACLQDAWSVFGSMFLPGKGPETTLQSSCSLAIVNCSVQIRTTIQMPKRSFLASDLCVLMRRSAHSGCSSASSQRSLATAAARRLDFAGHRTLSYEGRADEISSSRAVRLSRIPADRLKQMAAQIDLHPDGCSSATGPAQQSNGAEEDAVSGYIDERHGHANGSKLSSPQDASTIDGPVASGSAGRYSAAGDGMRESTEFSRTSAGPPVSMNTAPPLADGTAAYATGQEHQSGLP